jgi:hypothetical protein
LRKLADRSADCLGGTTRVSFFLGFVFSNLAIIVTPAPGHRAVTSDEGIAGDFS